MEVSFFEKSNDYTLYGIIARSSDYILVY